MPRAPKRVAEIGEFGLLAHLLPRLPVGGSIIVGPGDDCAVVRTPAARLLLTVDALVEDVHFRRGWLTSRQLGRKAFRINASDIAAMGGTPQWAVLHVSAPPRTLAVDLAGISRGAAAAAREAGAWLVGGNLARARELSVTLALIGTAPRHPVTRRGAHAGDLLFVTGTLGAAALGVRALIHDPAARGAGVQRFREPPMRVRAGTLLAASGVARAMIDVSDGLVQDLGHLCAASGIGACIELARVPMDRALRRADPTLALAGGEDYELLCAIPSRHRRRAEQLAVRFGCTFTCIGVCTPARSGVTVVDSAGRRIAVPAGGHDHFSGRRAR